MARVHGKYGQVWFDSSTASSDPLALALSPENVLGVSTFTISEEGSADEATGTDSGGVRQYTAGLHGWKAHVEAFWDTADTKLKGAPPKITAGMCCRVKLCLTPSSSLYYDGYGVTTAVEISVPVDGNITFSLDIQGSGNWLTRPS